MNDESFLRAAMVLARQALSRGNHPFGALLVDPQGNVLLEAQNTVETEQDSMGHAESNLIRLAVRQLSPEVLATSTLYASGEPCPMCAGAIYWSGIKRVVFGLSVGRLEQLLSGNIANLTLTLPCREIFIRGNRPINVQGPLLEDEAAAVLDGWTALIPE
jgi:tRNA(Arg) A34 adenosine deaminase TadA